MRRYLLNGAPCVLLIAALGCGGGGTSGGPETFTTSVPADQPLGGLSDDELTQLCADGHQFASDADVQKDNCRLAGYLSAAFSVAFQPDATDSDLRKLCSDSYDQCIASGSQTQPCNRPPANCTATVGEYVTCINDQAEAQHAFVATIPACKTLTRASLTADGGTATAGPAYPASCQAAMAKCSGLSDAADAFVSDYCALVEPCCDAQGLSVQCALLTREAAQQGPYDETAAAACLAALRQRQAGADYCGGLAVISGGLSGPSWAVIPECAAVFQSGGTTPPGGSCSDASSCAPGPRGGAECVFGTFVGKEDPFAMVCVQISDQVGESPCLGTVTPGFGYSGVSDPPPVGVLCDQSRGARCDSATFTCVATQAVGDPCDEFDDCNTTTSYCRFDTGRCEARLPLGAACAGSLFGECAGNAYCHPTTKTCTAPGDTGAACSAESVYPPDCLSGSCLNGTCTNPLNYVCL
jgi:hypothetical protein